jgi:penicillin amidase/acyl-homoserine-lactone acylase
MGLATNQTNRSLRLMELNDGVTKLGKPQLLELKFDDQYSANSSQYELIKKIMAIDTGEDPGLRAAVEHLATWDRRTNKENNAAALAVLTLRSILRGDTPDDHSDDALSKALQSAVGYLKIRFGRIDVAWGEVNRLVRGEVDLPIDGGPDILRAIYSFGLPADTIPYATHGDTWMALVEWDEQGKQYADVLHQFGSATLDSTSPHFDDQAPLFVAKQWRRALLDRDEVLQNASRQYRLGRD